MLNIILLFSASQCSRCFFAVSGTNGISTKNQDVSLSKIHLVLFTWPAREVLLSIALMSWKGKGSGCSYSSTIEFGFVLSASPSSERINEESLTLKTSAFETFNRNNLTFNNSVNKTNFLILFYFLRQCSTTLSLEKPTNRLKFKMLGV